MYQIKEDANFSSVMITREQLEDYLGNEATKDIPALQKKRDNDFTAIQLLRERIPYKVCHSIIQGAEHDVVYLVNIDECLKYLSEKDLVTLAECNVFLDEDLDSLGLFV